MAAFFGKKESDFVKTLLYNVDGKVIAFCIPGDRELNETKALKLLGANEMEMASFEEVEKVTHARVGFAGPVGIDCPVYMDRQIKHMKNIVKHKGICFLLIAINSEYYALPAKMLFNFIDKKERKSIPYDFIKENGYKLDYNYLKGIDYIKAVDLMIKENV